jgi:hypothetical protein
VQHKPLLRGLGGPVGRLRFFVNIFPADCKSWGSNGLRGLGEKTKAEKKQQFARAGTAVALHRPHDVFELFTGPDYNAAFN